MAHTMNGQRWHANIQLDRGPDYPATPVELVALTKEGRAVIRYQNDEEAIVDADSLIGLYR